MTTKRKTDYKWSPERRRRYEAKRRAEKRRAALRSKQGELLESVVEEAEGYGWKQLADGTLSKELPQHVADKVLADAPPPNALSVQVGGDHYKNMAIQPVEFISQNNLGFLEGNAIKYLCRHKAKGGASDVQKVIHYCQLILQLQYGEG